jgi:hypothetical protein
MFLATYRDGLYDFVLFLHLTAAIVGFGGVLLNGVYGAQAKKRPGPGGLAITEANLFVSEKFAEPAIYLVPLLGFALIGLSDSAFSFSEGWVIGAIVIYAIGLVNARLVLVPTTKQMIEMMQAGPPDPGKMEALGKRLGAAGGASHLLFTIIMVLMIWKPGH